MMTLQINSQQETAASSSLLNRIRIPILAFLMITRFFSTSQTFAENKSQPAGSGKVTLFQLTGKVRTGQLETFDNQQLTISETGNKRQFLWNDLLWLRFQHEKTQKTSSQSATVYLANGDRIRLQPTGIADEMLLGNRFESATVKHQIKIPLMTIRGVVFREPDTAMARNKLKQILLNHREKKDLLILRNGDRITGRFDKLDDSSVTFSQPDGKTLLRGIRAVVFNPRYLDFPKPKNNRKLLWLHDGSRLTATRIEMQNNGRIKVLAAYGETLELVKNALRAIRVLGTKTISLSDLKPSAYQYTPFLDGQWKLTNDKNVQGGRLILRGREFAKGIGMHSRSRATYMLDGKSRFFLATVGIDDAAKGKGSVRVAVELDGKRTFISPLITGKSQSIRIGPIPLAGKKQLTLTVEFGEFGDVCDIVNWCDAILVK
jgi:hypothetical protein